MQKINRRQRTVPSDGTIRQLLQLTTNPQIKHTDQANPLIKSCLLWLHGDGATHGSLLGPADRDLSSVWGQFNLHAVMRRHRMLFRAPVERTAVYRSDILDYNLLLSMSKNAL